MADDEAVPAVASTEDGSEVLEWVKVAARAAAAKSGEDTIVLEVGAVLSITGWFVITSGGNSRLVKTLALEWGGGGVRGCSIWPGPIAETEGMSRLAGSTAGALADFEAIKEKFAQLEKIVDSLLTIKAAAAIDDHHVKLTVDVRNVPGAGLSEFRSCASTIPFATSRTA